VRIFIKLLAFLILLVSSFVIYDRYEMRKPVVFEALHQIDPLPKTKKLISQNRLVEADEYLSFFVDHGYLKNNEQAQALLIEIKRKREDLEYRAKKIADGVLKGKSDELDGQIAAGISDFFLFGDLRDLTIEGYHKLTNQEVDEILVALSSVGVMATGMTVISGGTSTTVKSATSFLKFAKKSGKLPNWLGKYLVKLSKQVNKTKDFTPIRGLFNQMKEMISSSGVSGSLKLLSHTNDLKSLKKAVAFSKTYGKSSSTLLSILGKDAFKYTNPKVSKKAFLYASTYGKAGVKRITKVGEIKFFKSLSKPLKASRVAKVFGKNGYTIFKMIPDYVFYILGLISLMILV